MLTLIALLLLVYGLLHTSPVQNWLVHQATKRLSKDLETTVKIDRVNFTFFNKLVMEGTLVQDRNKDTLLYAGKLKVNITDWFFLKDKATLEYVGLEDARVFLHRSDSVWNHRFLADYFSGGSSSGNKKSIQLDLKEVDLKNIHFLQKDEWRGEDMAIYLRSLHVKANQLDIEKKMAHLESVEIEDPIFSIYNYPGKRKKKPFYPSIDHSKDSTLRWNPEGWQLAMDALAIKNGSFKSHVFMNRAPYHYFDGNYVKFDAINASFKNLRLQKDTLFANLQLTTKERSGFEVKKFNAAVKWHPEAMEFSQLDLRTNKSRLSDYYAMRYNEFDDMSDFIEKIKLQGTFKDAIIHSDDIAYFAPELASWNKEVHLSGTIKGTIENLGGKNLIVKTGNSTLLEGDFILKGLPEIDKTYIDVKANKLATTYADALLLVPALRTVKNPRLDRLSYINFTGNLTGFVKDFVTHGTLQTALGTISSDVNLKFPDNKAAQYSGKIASPGFNIGALIDNDDFGNIQFNSTVKGNAASDKNLEVEVNGEVQQFSFKNYNYQNISIKGLFDNKLFKGQLIARDPHLDVVLNGLINLNHKVPEFDFIAAINKANLKALNFIKDDVDFNGNLRFDFTGNTIDNFLGTARITDASIFKNGNRISFDSLSVESKKIGDSKSIVAVSNEFDAALVGDFSIVDLPTAFQTFLNRYYPSYIAPAKRSPGIENFSFVITTKKVDEYLDLVDKDLKGFNNTTITGRINTAENLFDLDAEVPQFSYQKTAFYNVMLKGRGNLDTLSVQSTIGDVFVNDSLHFPDTKINISSGGDISKVKVKTSANQTLNAADISGTVQTMKNGFSVVFDPSTFDVNGKRWNIDRDGELTLTRDLVTTDGLRIYSGDQEVVISSQPSETGNSNDLRIDLKKINIGDFAPFFVKENRLEGLLSGQVDVIDPFGKMNVDVKAEAEQFRLDDDSVGKLSLTTNYSKATGKVNFTTLSENKNYNFSVNGFVNTLDSARDNTIDINTELRGTSISLLNRYLTDIFSQLDGQATGNLRIVGKGNDLKYLGNIQLKDGQLMVDYTKCLYLVPEAKIKLTEEGIDFGSFTIKDQLGNTGELVTGKLYHSNFKDMGFDFKVRTNRMLLLNTTARDNSQFYGRAIGKANFIFKGPQEDMLMEVQGEATDSSEITLPNTTGRASSEASFLTWKVYGKELTGSGKIKESSNLLTKLELTANRLTKINMVLDENAGDQISARGHGTIKLRIGTREPLTMAGRYDIDEGNYNFSFQSIKRYFTLRTNTPNYIQWVSDPYDATLNVTAEYKAPNVRFSDLGLNNTSLGSSINEDTKRYRGDILVLATITDKLKAPNIKLGIEMPDNSPLKNDPSTQVLLNQIRSDVNELNKQVSLLIVFNSFGPLSTSPNSSFNIVQGGLEGIVLNSISSQISSVLTKEISSKLQKVLNDPSLKIDISASFYNGSNLYGGTTANTGIDRSAVNFSINKSYFNERLTFIVGSALDIGWGARTTAQGNLQFLPDVTAQYKLTADGKLLFNLFYRQNFSFVIQNKQNRSGASISYRREFEKFGDLFRRKNKKKKEAKKPEENVVTSSQSQ